jgi:hypothetical protein
MKKAIVSLLIALVAFVVTSCFETTEEVTINESGSGLYQANIDLSGFFLFIDMMKAMDTSASASNKPAMQSLDTVVYMKSFTDTASNLTKEEKALVHDATMHMVMKEKEKVFKINISYPYSKPADVQKIIRLNQSNSNLIGKALKDKTSMPEENQQQQPAMPDFSSVYDVVYQKGMLEKKLNAEKLQKFQSDENYATLKQMKEMFATSAMNTVIHLPKAAKKAEGPNVKLSGDKKTVTINATLGDIFDQPDLLSYHIEY